MVFYYKFYSRKQKTYISMSGLGNIGITGPGTREISMSASTPGFDATNSPTQVPHYFKSDRDCTLVVHMMQGSAATFQLPVVKGYNIERIDRIFVAGSCGSAVLVGFV